MFCDSNPWVFAIIDLNQHTFSVLKGVTPTFSNLGISLKIDLKNCPLLGKLLSVWRTVLVLPKSAQTAQSAQMMEKSNSFFNVSYTWYKSLVFNHMTVKKTTNSSLAWKKIHFLKLNKKILFPAGLEPATFRVWGGRDNHYTTETDKKWSDFHIDPKFQSFFKIALRFLRSYELRYITNHFKNGFVKWARFWSLQLYLKLRLRGTFGRLIKLLDSNIKWNDL